MWFMYKKMYGCLLYRHSSASLLSADIGLRGGGVTIRFVIFFYDFQ